MEHAYPETNHTHDEVLRGEDGFADLGELSTIKQNFGVHILDIIAPNTIQD